MRYQSLAVVSGIGLFQLAPSVPHPLVYVSVFPFAWLVYYSPRARLAGLCGLGVLWAMLRADIVLSTRLPPAQQGQILTVTGTVSGGPSSYAAATRFDFKLDEAPAANGAVTSLAKLKLT